MIDLLILLLKPSLHFLSNPRKYFYLAPFVILATLADMIAARTTWRAIAGPLKSGERTISDSLERLCTQDDNPNVQFYIQLGLLINRIDPLHSHIKVLACPKSSTVEI